MLYEAELRFLQESFEKCYLKSRIIDASQPFSAWADLGVRALFYADDIYSCSFSEMLPDMQPAVIYKYTDSLLCCYMFFLLPGEQERILLIGPYLLSDLSEQQVLEGAEKFGLEPRYVQQLKNYYSDIPVLPADSQLFVMLEVFAERIWGGSENYHVENIEKEPSGAVSPLFWEKMINGVDDVAFDMQLMEKRYAFENELMQAVTQGQMNKVERLLGGFSKVRMEQRLTDPIREMKNYCIIMNTLLRKAAENGGVHPVHLNSVSSSFARKIELLVSETGGQELMRDMFRTYCRLVRKHSISRYSPLIQKVIIQIDGDLTADLSLHALAEKQNVSAGYLSALFKQEMGQTLTEYVNEKRIRQAMQLLKTTKLQVQTIAQHCGVVDVHYFSKMFRKAVGKTPKEYRETN